MQDLTKRAWIEINLNSIRHNYHQIRNYIGKDTKFLGVVKANAYGHGDIEISKVLEELKADYLAVACIDEAIELRKNNIKLPILILGYTPSCYTKQLIEYDITQGVPNIDIANEYNDEAYKLNKTLKIHIKIDTGMSRLGFISNDVNFKKTILDIKKLFSLSNLNIEGIFTHFSVSDESNNESKEYTLNQFEQFKRVIDELNEDNFNFKFKHCCNSAATLYYPEMYMDMVRPGLLLYGYGDDKNILNLKQCMSLKTRINTIKEIDKDVSVSYGRHFVTSKPTKIATLGIGYADGLFRSLSNKCSFYCNGNKVSQVGNICMDMCMVDVSNLDVHVDDIVEIFGSNNDLNELSNIANTIPYEFLCAISNRVKRIYK